ncbi:hypothetical protein QE152_g39875 [Popillia japonica]|uniref:Uncharacterized protein n=1 Tax=Popillia japonica TaxID=7064 RepID=A0AAW1HT43_POPJA
MKKVYDFNDYKKAIENTKAKVIEMRILAFALWKDHSKKCKAKDLERVYLRDILEISAKRGNCFLSYRTDFEKPALPLNFIRKAVQKTGKLPLPKHLVYPTGISEQPRNGILKLIEGNKNIIPSNRLEFWTNIADAHNE